MSSENVNCNQCGAPIEIARTTNFVTCARCGAALAIRRTGSSTFTEAAETPGEFTSHDLVDSVRPAAAKIGAGAQLSDLQRQNEINRLENQLNRLDLEWEREKEQYMISGRYGYRYLPSKGWSVGSGVMTTAFGCLWIVFAFGVTTGFTFDLQGEPFGPPPIVRLLFPLFGVVFVLGGIGWSIYAYNKADQYEQAFARYRQRRMRVLDEIEDVRRV